MLKGPNWNKSLSLTGRKAPFYALAVAFVILMQWSVMKSPLAMRMVAAWPLGLIEQISLLHMSENGC